MMIKIITRKNLFLATALLIFSNGTAQAQENKGIYFEHGLSWDQIKTKAKAENKFIFVDVFATWCGPCKWMDENTYPSDKLTSLNDKFISVKVQMDSTRNDSDEIKAWRENVSRMKADYNIKTYPTFLFFDPNGQAVHKYVGRFDDSTFFKVALNALNPKKQYFTLLNAYRKKVLSYEYMPMLARTATVLGELKEVDLVAEDYINNYLYKLKDGDLFTKENLSFVTTEGFKSFSSKSRMFFLIYNNPGNADRIIGNNGFAQNMISWVIKKEELYNKLWNPDRKTLSKEPDWVKITAAIKRKYGVHYADSLILPTKLFFYQSEKNWKQYQVYAEIAYNSYPPKKGGKRFGTAVGVDPRSCGTDAWGLNQIAWTLFEGSNDKLQLEKALKWSDQSIKIEPLGSRELNQYLDTKANLLYKLGRIDEAIACEEKAIKDPYSQLFVKNYQETLEKMKRNIITWSDTVAKP